VVVTVPTDGHQLGGDRQTGSHHGPIDEVDLRNFRKPGSAERGPGAGSLAVTGDEKGALSIARRRKR